MNISDLDSEHIKQQVLAALEEDLNGQPDYTAQLVTDETSSSAVITSNQDMVLCGVAFASQAFITCNPDVRLDWYKADGDSIVTGDILVKITGNARGLLTAERTALNFIQTLSATATEVNKYVKQVADTKAKIMDTRKTIPGLRLAQKYAVTVGGGYNQRVGLYDGVLIKENHIAALGGVKQALVQAMAITPKHIPIQIEVETIEQFQEAIKANAKLILLDNMSVTEIKECVQFNANQADLEASGSINLDNVLEYAKTGVDRISIGKLTKNINAIDLSMRFIN